jgi:glycosyltransferase involved in cell wall biosynthesis
MGKKKSVAIIGTNGIPASYGGYETLTEFLVENLSDQFDFTVYCSKEQKKKYNYKTYKGAKLKYLPFKANGAQSVFYDSLSILISLFKHKTLLVLGAPGGFMFFLNFIFRKNMIINHGGFNEWERDKYSKLQKLWGIYTRKVASYFAKTNVCDNPLIKESIKKTFNADSVIIEYGGDHTQKIHISDKALSTYSFLSEKYFLCVARAQVDNNIHILIDAFKKTRERKLVVVSNWEVTEYGRELYKENVDKFDNIILLKAIYNKEDLDTIRSNAFVYIHSHSYCGTAPSLVEAMSLDLPIVSFDVPTNRYTTKEKAWFFKTADDLADVITALDDSSVNNNAKEMGMIAKERYTWKRISDLYAEIF